MAKVQKPFEFKHVQYNPGDEIDLDALDPEDKADLISRGCFDKPREEKQEADKPKRQARRSKSK